MLLFRIICAVAVAWAVIWVLSQPEAARLIRAIPDMAALAPIAAAYVGACNLAVRQGWGVIVALANGAWSGVLCIISAGVLYMAVDLARETASGEVTGIRSFFDCVGDAVELLVIELSDVPLLMLALATTAAAGVLTEMIHWLMVRVRSRWQRSN